MITEEQYKQISKFLEIETACVKAVKDVESKGSGFLSTGEPVILFEPHVFWRELKLVGIDPKKYQKENPNILYEKWGSKPYGKYSEQHDRLEKAVNIHREAALKSASWGLFQIMGNNYKLCGFDSIQDFINAMYKDEYSHLLAFANFIKSRGLVKFLQKKDWTSFAKGYNGPGYIKNNYHIKLENAYNKYK